MLLHSPQLALDPVGQIVSHLNGEVLTVQRLHLVQSVSLELLCLDPHCHLQHPEVGKQRRKRDSHTHAHTKTKLQEGKKKKRFLEVS